uniref:Chemosensory protein 18 n=1 Tax=Oedaleus infernalis TaxID=267432 RepID=A0A3G2LGI5_9ORTH|nr:chemosensory protein 18 [Oedaleus infernalis]
MAHLQAALCTVATLAALLVAVCAQGGPAQSFARPERLDVDSAIHNETRFQEAMACILGEDDYRLCDHHTVGIKYDGWRMLERGCGGTCTPDEQSVYRFLAYVSHNKPDQWRRILDKFDPDGKLQQSNSEQWRQHGIKV